MNQFARTIWTQDDGALSFEWALTVTLLVIGVVGGLSAARDAIIDELGDAAQAMLALDDSYVLDQPLRLQIDLDGAGSDFLPVEPGSAAGSSFTDAQSFVDCARTPAGPENQPAELDADS